MRFLIAILVTLSLSGYGQKKSPESSPEKAKTLEGFNFRSLGPAFLSGRIIDLAVDVHDANKFYVAVACGGVWKTLNHGNTFTPIFDATGSYSVGCVAIDPSNSHTIWVGSGENNNQRSVGYGDGVYKSVDDGASFKNMGLASSEHIAKIVVHPTNSNLVYVAAYGPLWNDGGDRGVYKSENGGETWERVLHVSDKTGISDLWMDPRNPEVLYASAHQRRRHVWTYLSGGPESAVYKSTDGGKNWRKIINGFPADCDLGRIALAVSPANADVVYAMVEGFDSEHGGFYRSTNMGEQWVRQSDYFTSGNYYVELIPDPLDPDKVFSMDTWLKHTEDGGKTFKNTGEKNKHVDNHAMWINPKNNRHWLVGCDGGLYETWDAAENWKYYPNLSVTQFYRVALDNAAPFYNVYGGTQDNNTIGGPSRTTSMHGITNYDWYVTRGGDGFEPQIDPTNPNIIYSQAQYGWLARYNKTTGERVNIKPVERASEEPYRWNWDAPLLISPHHSKRLYFAANKVFRSDDQGNTWSVISDDLSRNLDRNTLRVMGTTWGPEAVAIHQSTSVYGNIVAMSESPVKEGLLYIGTDDGLIQVTEDNGGSWRKIASIPGVPERTYVSDIHADLHNENVVYAALNNHKNGDFTPYLLKSADKGKTWTSITAGLPERGSVHCVEQDHVSPELLFAGTEFGVYCMTPESSKWVQMKGGLPVIAIRDIAIQRREDDLVLASFGRGFYVLDNYAPLRTIADTAGKASHVFPIKDAYIFNESSPLSTRDKGSQGDQFHTTPNPPVGAVFRYYLKDKPLTAKEKRRLSEQKIRKAAGDVIYPSLDSLRLEDHEEKGYAIFEIQDNTGHVVSRFREDNLQRGINQCVWDFRMETVSPVKLKKPDVGIYSNPDWGSLVSPGEYSVVIYTYYNGKLEQLAPPTSFSVKLLHNTQVSPRSLGDIQQFIQQINDVRKSAFVENEKIAKLETRIQYMKQAVLETPAARTEWIEQCDKLNLELIAIRTAFHGDATRTKRELPTYPGIIERIETAADNVYNHTESPTQSESISLGIARSELENQMKALRLLETQVNALSEKLKESGAPAFEP